MNEKKLKDTAKKHAPNTHKVKHACVAFLCGGSLAVVAQLVMLSFEQFLHIDRKSATSMTIVSVILLTSILTGFGVYDKVAQKCGAGLFIPISGFANSLTSSALEGKSEGPIYGIGSNMFKLAGSVLTYGIASAFVFGLLRYLFFGG